MADADAVNPRFTAGWLDYAQHCGFATDAARVRSPKDKPRVERTVQYVRGNFFAGETFTGLADAQARAEAWCRGTARMRIHGTIAARPAEVFTEHEAAVLLPLSLPYDVPVFTRVKVHRDFHVEIGRALYSAPKEYLGCRLDARVDSALVKLFHRGQLVKAHPRVDAARQQHGAGGCPLGSLCSELSDDHPWARDALAASFTAWSEAIRAGLAAMIDNGTLPPETDPGQLALALLTALQGGLLLAQARTPPMPSKPPWTP